MGAQCLIQLCPLGLHKVLKLTTSSPASSLFSIWRLSDSRHIENREDPGDKVVKLAVSKVGKQEKCPQIDGRLTTECPGERYSSEFVVGVCHPGFPNPDPISDQSMPFSIPVFRPGPSCSKAD